MNRVNLIVLVMLPLIALGGCGSRDEQNSQSAEQMQTELDQIRAAANEKRVAELENEGVLSPDSAPLDDMLRSIDKAAKNSSGKQAEVLARQAEILGAIQGYTKPYEQKVNELVAVGSIDPATIQGAEDIDRRMALIGELDSMNERMDREMPRLLRELGRIEQRTVQTERQIDLLGKIRDTDRRMFAAMTEMLGTLRDRWDGIQIQADGNFLFGADTPDEQVDRYNELFEQIDEAALEQGQLQRALLELP